MKISAKTDYACRAILELSLHWPNSEPLSIQAISDRQNIPLKFLIQILLNLKQLDLVRSVRGQKGGYLLGKASREITLKEVIQYFSEKNLAKSRQVSRKRSSILDSIWQEAENVYFNFLEGKNFEDMAKKQKNLVEVLMYTI